MEAALSVFSERGVDATTIERITDRADVGKGTFYRHFVDKDEIMISLVETSVAKLCARIDGCLNDGAAESLEGALEYLLDAHAQFFSENTEEFILLFQGRVLLKLQRETAEDLEQPYETYLQTIESHLSRFVSRRMDPIKVRRLACAVAGFVFGFLSFAMIGMGTDEIDTSLRPLRRAFVSGLSTFLAR